MPTCQIFPSRKNFIWLPIKQGCDDRYKNFIILDCSQEYKTIPAQDWRRHKHQKIAIIKSTVRGKSYDDQAPAGSRDWTEIPIPGFLKMKSRDFLGFFIAHKTIFAKTFIGFQTSLGGLPELFVLRMFSLQTLINFTNFS